jgi:hypothetical protein
VLNMDLIIGGILEYYKLFLIAIGVYVLARIFIKHRKKLYLNTFVQIVKLYMLKECQEAYLKN